MDFIANMPGPQFAGVYLVVTVVVLIVGYWLRHLAYSGGSKLPYALAIVASFALIDGLGIYKLVIAYSRGYRNVNFLLLTLFFGSIMAFGLLSSPSRRRVYGGRGAVGGVFWSTGGCNGSCSSSYSSSSSCSSSSCSSSCGGGCGGCGSS